MDQLRNLACSMSAPELTLNYIISVVVRISMGLDVPNVKVKCQVEAGCLEPIRDDRRR
jgi:hypothetical protein